MADSENSPACALRNAQIDVKTFLYELRVLLEGLAHGVKTLIGNLEAEPVRSELEVLASFTDQAVEAFECPGIKLAFDFGSQRQKRSAPVALFAAFHHRPRSCLFTSNRYHEQNMNSISMSSNA